MRQSPERLVGWLTAALIAALLAASCVQVADGRTDARRSHGALSATLWGLTAVFAAILGGLAWWARRARRHGPRANRRQRPDVAPWAVGGRRRPAPRGPRRGDVPLRHRRSGARLRIRSGDAVFSANGARAAWTEERFGFFEKGRKSDLFVADLASAKAVETGLECSVWCRVALSPSGTKARGFRRDTRSRPTTSRDPVEPEAARGDSGSRRLEEHSSSSTTTRSGSSRDSTSRETGRTSRRGDLEIDEISLLSKKSFVTGRFEREAFPFCASARTGDTSSDPKDERLTLHDGRTGALVATLSEDLEGRRVAIPLGRPHRP